MFKHYLMLPLSLAVLMFACVKEQDENLQNRDNEVSADRKVDFKEMENDRLKEWTDYYQTLDASFDLAKFQFSGQDTIHYMDGWIDAIYDSNFDSVYLDYLIFSPNQKKYIDIDSYFWQVEDGRAYFSPDQEIDLVDIEEKTIKRVAFRGPSQIIESAFWINNKIFFLLENSEEFGPSITEFNLDNNLKKYYQYKDSVHIESQFTENKLKKKGIFL